MTVSNVKHAEKLVRRAVKQSDDPIGSQYSLFWNEFFGTRRPTQNEVGFVRQALVNLEKRKEVFVLRDDSGDVVSVDRYDCSRAISDPERPSLENYELMIVMHRMLIDMCSEDGAVHSGESP